jgi:hypothetical protein
VLLITKLPFGSWSQGTWFKMPGFYLPSRTSVTFQLSLLLPQRVVQMGAI